MAVPKGRTSRAKRDTRRAHDALSNPTLSIDDMTGETHRRHHVTADGYYRGQQRISTASADDFTAEDDE